MTQALVRLQVPLSCPLTSERPPSVPSPRASLAGCPGKHIVITQRAGKAALVQLGLGA